MVTMSYSADLEISRNLTNSSEILKFHLLWTTSFGCLTISSVNTDLVSLTTLILDVISFFFNLSAPFLYTTIAHKIVAMNITRVIMNFECIMPFGKKKAMLAWLKRSLPFGVFRGKVLCAYTMCLHSGGIYHTWVSFDGVLEAEKCPLYLDACISICKLVIILAYINQICLFLFQGYRKGKCNIYNVTTVRFFIMATRV